MSRRTRHMLRANHGFTLIEASFSILLTGTLILASLAAVGGSVKARVRHESTTTGFHAAHDLLNEVLSQPYEDSGAAPAWGLEAGEDSTIRSTWDDVDDYADWFASPPVRRDGTVIPELNGWTRAVTVTWAMPDNPQDDSGAETGVKRIEVTVVGPNGHETVARGLRSRAGGRDIAPAASGNYILRTTIRIELGTDPERATTVETSTTQVNHVLSNP